MNMSSRIISAIVHNFFSLSCLRLKCDVGRPLLSIGGILLCLLSAALVCTIFGCGGNGASKPLATVDGMTISIAEFNKRFVRDANSLLVGSSLTPEEYEHIKEEVLNILIDEKVMLLRAKELSISVSDAELMKKAGEIKESNTSDEGFDKANTTRKVDYGQWKEELRKRIILEKLISADVNSKIQVKEEEKKVHVAQIVVREQQKAEAILKRLMKGEDFAKVAREESIGPEAKAGGDLGFVSQGFMPEEIDAAIFSQQPGEIGPVIRSPFGYHIFKIIEKGKKGSDDIEGRVLTDLKKQKEEEEYSLWLGALRSKAAIKINRDLLKDTVPQISEAD
jgi:parvulin-like peptidyl-prolyl isomerase